MNKPLGPQHEAVGLLMATGAPFSDLGLRMLTRALERAERRGELRMAKKMEATFREWERCRLHGSGADHLVMRGFKSCADWCTEAVAKFEKESELNTEPGEGSK